ncbi:unnamed protein product [Bursaphelenchus xylophilus]|uniref:(pine wood nematode) hypothetical protein n=1 Tax=Bursaphelenchus xylophilus TaxID=6326 RepID=A0A811LPE7_BURXY|nr:unnamed protein product [Bursaphelenchus xylophilus]CAG9121260.1 unnamed protein product [Bursaphelenchus xylophilus]
MWKFWRKRVVKYEKNCETEGQNGRLIRNENIPTYSHTLVEGETQNFAQNQSFWTPQPFDFGQNFLSDTSQPRGYSHQRQHSIATAEPFIDFQPQTSQFGQFQPAVSAKANGSQLAQSQSFIGQRQQSLPERSVPYYYVDHPPPPKHPHLRGMSTSQVASSSHLRAKKDDHSAFPSTSNPQMLSSQHPMDVSQAEPKKKEIYVYSSPFNLYGMAWSTRPEPENKFRLAVGSFIEEYNNKISLVQLREDVGEFKHLGTFDHPYPATKVLWIPDKKGRYPDLIATTGDYLRIWAVGGPHGAVFESMLDNNRSSQYCAPLTSADWNEVEPSLIATSSIDTTCTIWEIETGKPIAERKPTKGNVKTQLIAHDREVFDIAFSKINSGKDVFGSVGADGSVRMFDIRHMEYSMIVFEEPNRKPLLRLAFNQHDHNYLATFAQDSPEVYIIDIRIPSIPVATLKNHCGAVNAISWAPHSSCHICTVAEDKQALIWDVHNMPRPVEDPILAYSAAGEINQVEWSSSMTDWISISYGKKLELLRV